MESDSVGDHRHSAVILVVERDPHVRELEAFFLEKAGFSVEFAQDGIEALDLVESSSPDIVITEVLVPGIDGLSLCRRIKAVAREIKILVFSILSAEERALEAGADAYLRKPLEEQRLVKTVEELLAVEMRKSGDAGAARDAEGPPSGGKPSGEKRAEAKSKVRDRTSEREAGGA